VVYSRPTSARRGPQPYLYKLVVVINSPDDRLLIQASLPCLLFAGGTSTLDLKGGTDADLAPMADYFTHVRASVYRPICTSTHTQVFLPHLRLFGGDFSLAVRRRGYFPRGGGNVIVSVDDPLIDCPLRAVDLTDQGRVENVTVWASVGGKLSPTVADEIGAAAVDKLRRGLPSGVQINVERQVHRDAACNGSGVLCVARTSTGRILGDSAVGSPKTHPRNTGSFAAVGLLASIGSGACLDRWMQVRERAGRGSTCESRV